MPAALAAIIGIGAHQLSMAERAPRAYQLRSGAVLNSLRLSTCVLGQIEALRQFDPTACLRERTFFNARLAFKPDYWFRFADKPVATGTHRSIALTLTPR